MLLLQTALTITVAGPPASPEYLPLRIAEAEGYFADEGLRVTLRTVRAETGAAEALARGQADLAATSLDAALRLAHVQGAPPRLVFGLTRSAPVALLVPAGLKDSVRTVQDLVGKTVGVPAPGTPEHGHLLSILGHARVPIARVSIESLGDRALAGAVESGAVAAAMVGEPWATRLLEDGKAVALVDLRERRSAATWLGGDTVHAAVFVRADAPTRDLASLARALLRANERLASATPEVLAAALPPSLVGSPEDWRARVGGARGVLLDSGRVDVEALERSVGLIKLRAPIPATVSLPRRLDRLLLAEPVEDALRRRR
jgi:NitT/TauT family transport system substrate-binding protein